MSSGTLKSRTEGFARRIVRLCLPLLEDARTHHVARHLLRSGTAANANYGSAHRGRTREEFAARLEQACDDITEAKEWIDLLWGVTATDELSALRAEAEDLEKLLAIACRTARAPGEEADAIGR